MWNVAEQMVMLAMRILFVNSDYNHSHQHDFSYVSEFCRTEEDILAQPGFRGGERHTRHGEEWHLQPRQLTADLRRGSAATRHQTKKQAVGQLLVTTAGARKQRAGVLTCSSCTCQMLVVRKVGCWPKETAQLVKARLDTKKTKSVVRCPSQG